MHYNSAFKEPFVAKLSAQDGDWLLCSHERRVAGWTGRTIWWPDRPTDPGGEWDRNRIVRLTQSLRDSDADDTASDSDSGRVSDWVWLGQSNQAQRKSQAMDGHGYAMLRTCCCMYSIHNCTSVPLPCQCSSLTILCFPVFTPSLAIEQLSHELKQQSYRAILS